jgi:CDP-2,3-bis-(O-geranylgeranyl)-sn-glycerol synthase
MGRSVLQMLWVLLPAYAANMAPVLARGHCRALAVPLDAGRTWRGRRVLGDHKTWRGLLVGVAAGALAFEAQWGLYDAGYLRALAPVDPAVLGHGAGVLIGLGALLGDALKSFVKRQIGIAPGASWIGPDQIDFFLGASLLLACVWTPPLTSLVVCLPIVFVADLAVSAVGYSFGLKEAWI